MSTLHMNPTENYKCKKYKFPLYPLNLHIGVTKHINSEYGAFVVTTKPTDIFMILEKNNARNYGVIAHECMHVIQRAEDALSSRGNTLGLEGEAYLMEWVMNTVVKHMNK